MSQSVVSFLSDYGLQDEFVGVVKGVISSFSPSTPIIDITHNIAPHDIRAASLALARAVQYLPDGIILAIVDPGVGSNRKAIAVEVNDGGKIFIAPDNGLLPPALALFGGVKQVVQLNNEQYHIKAFGGTFAGRDIFAPAIGQLLSGTELKDLGDSVEIHDLKPSLIPVPKIEEGYLESQVIWIDHFGNAQLNLDAQDIAFLEKNLKLVVNGKTMIATRVKVYQDLADHQLGLLVDSYGMACLSMNCHSAALALGLETSTQVTLSNK